MNATRPTPTLPATSSPGEWFGLRAGDRGTHTSRTMMLREFDELLKLVPTGSEAGDYRRAIVDDNLLGKKTMATRRLTAQRLSELYALDPAVPVFRVLRGLWSSDRQGRPVLALLVAYSRDPLLRATADAVILAPLGHHVSTDAIDSLLAEKLGDRLNDAVRHKVARNAASTWTQAGHLRGRTRKIRAKPVATPATAALALLLGHVAGVRGTALFSTEWVRLLGQSHAELMSQVQAASRQGLLHHRQLGDVIELGFPDLIRVHEEALCHV